MNKFVAGTAFAVAMLIAGTASSQVILSKQANACIKKARGVMPEIEACLNGEFVRADQRNQKALARIKASNRFSPEQMKTYLDFHKVWGEARNVQCGIIGDEEWGGQMAGIQGTECLVNNTVIRANELEIIAGPE